MDRASAQTQQARSIRIRRRLQIASTLAIVALGALVAFRAIRPTNDDYKLFNGKSFSITRAIDGDSFVLADQRKTQVTLLGVDAPELPDSHFAAEAATYLTGRLKDARVLLKLDGTQTRDERDRLRAYVYLLDTDLLNADIIRDGRAYADRRTWHPFGPSMELLETEARRKKRGLWENLTNDQMPLWRQEWLKKLDRARR